MMSTLNFRLAVAAAFMICGTIGCVEDAGSGTATETDSSTETGGDAGANNADSILIDGSSTVWPVSMAMAEAFTGPKVEVQAPSGTSSGFKKFMAGTTDINDASRRIKDSEVATCKEHGIEALELTVAIDGISIVVNKENTWCDTLTFAQLKSLWEPDSKVATWKDLNPEWPEENIALFGPDGESGTFEYFTEMVCETSKKCREDYEPATDDNVLVKGVSGDKYALGYFGYGYYLKARQELKALKIASDGEAIAPTAKSIESYEYPLARPVFIYVNKNRLSDTGMGDFLRFYLGEGQKLVSKAGCVQLSPDVLAESIAALEAALAAK
jgi:phosphate transport system substrate-binding protein